MYRRLAGLQLATCLAVLQLGRQAAPSLACVRVPTACSGPLNSALLSNSLICTVPCPISAFPPITNPRRVVSNSLPSTDIQIVGQHPVKRGFIGRRNDLRIFTVQLAAISGRFSIASPS